MHKRSVWNVVKCLVTSRKVWVAAIGAATAVYLYIKGLISAEKLASSLVALATAVIVAIAAEDSAEKIGGARADVQIAEANARAAEAEGDDWPLCVKCGQPASYVTEGPTWYCEEHRPWDALFVDVRNI